MRWLWEEVMKWQARNGFPEALQKGKTNPPVPSKHEVVDALNRFVAETGLVNAHAGLTSSDIIDNTRLIQCEHSLKILRRKLGGLIRRITRFAEDYQETDCVGYTHWQVATKLTMGQRAQAWCEPLLRLWESPPKIRQKLLAGATGTRAALSLLVGEAVFQVPGLGIPNATAIQSSDHHSELEAAGWLSAIAGQLHKISQDIRFLCHTRELSIVRDSAYRGSSAMPKKRNPIEAEQICSLCRLQPNFQRQVWDALAFNGLERTLDTSAILRVTLPQMFENLAYVLEQSKLLFDNLVVNKNQCAQILHDNDWAANAELKMAQEIKDGGTRAEIYERYQN